MKKVFNQKTIAIVLSGLIVTSPVIATAKSTTIVPQQSHTSNISTVNSFEKIATMIPDDVKVLIQAGDIDSFEKIATMIPDDVKVLIQAEIDTGNIDRLEISDKLQQNGLAYAIGGDIQVFDVQPMTNQEMQATEGAMHPVIIIGLFYILDHVHVGYTSGTTVNTVTQHPDGTCTTTCTTTSGTWNASWN